MRKKPVQTAKRIKNCRHPLVRKAYYLGLPGEGYVCVACGERGDTPDWPCGKLQLTVTVH